MAGGEAASHKNNFQKTKKFAKILLWININN